MNIAEDPHHGGDNLWCVVDGRLFHKNENEEDWDEVRRVSYTPSRIKTIADLVYESRGKPSREELENEVDRLDQILVNHFNNNH
jgi:hypothetical protein